MKPSTVIMKFGIFYLVGALVLGLILTAVQAPDMSIVGILLIVLLLRYLVMEYMKEHKLSTLPSNTYWSIFWGCFGIVTAFNIVLLVIISSESSMNSDIVMIALLIGSLMNAGAVAAGLFQAKKSISKLNQTS